VVEDEMMTEAEEGKAQRMKITESHSPGGGAPGPGQEIEVGVIEAGVGITGATIETAMVPMRIF
jgi:hypothetical protein